MYIVIEGIDTAGKSTQLDLLRENYINAIFTKEPGGTVVGQEIRSMVLDGDISSKAAEMFLFLADRAEHFTKVIKPNMDKLIISDRSFISGISYAKEYDVDKLYELNMIALENMKPDLIVVLVLSRDDLTYRLSQKSHDKIELRGIDYLLDIQNNMINILKNLEMNHLVIDAAKDIDEINKIICMHISNNLSSIE